MGELVKATGWSCLFVATMALPVAGQGRRAELSTGDSALIGRILLAEDRRDSTDGALAEGSRHADSTRPDARATRARTHQGSAIRDARFPATATGAEDVARTSMAIAAPWIDRNAK